MNDIKVSLFASSIRPHLWNAFLDSLKGTTIDIEVVFAGNVANIPILDKGFTDFKYIRTKNIKPAQCYEVARRACSGELVHWTTDDAEFKDDVLGKAYRFFKKNCTNKDILSLHTKENYNRWIDCDHTQHHFFSATPESPKMAPLSLLNRQFLDDLGGIDKRYICGQWDNDIVMRLYNEGGNLYHFNDGYIAIDHIGKHDKKWGISAKRPFGQGYVHDRRILEGSWGRKGEMIYELPYKRFDKFEPFEGTNLMDKSQSYNIKEFWDA